MNNNKIEIFGLNFYEAGLIIIGVVLFGALMVSGVQAIDRAERALPEQMGKTVVINQKRYLLAKFNADHNVVAVALDGGPDLEVSQSAAITLGKAQSPEK